MREILNREELKNRVKRLCAIATDKYPDWDAILIIGRINQYYLTGTMQDGLIIIKRNGTLMYFARRSYERAKKESPISECIYPMGKYSDAAEICGKQLGNVLMDTDIATIEVLDRLKVHFKINEIYPIKKILSEVRSIKSPYELEAVKDAGKRHQYLLEEVVPNLLREGMSEVELSAELFEKMLKLGHNGVSRFNSFQTEMVIGQIAFGANSLYPTNFDGPGGMKGLNSAVPLFGSHNALLKKGDLVFIDVAFCMEGYHSDRTQVYMFGSKPSDEILKTHRKCVEIQKRTAALLKPNSIPSDIYSSIMSSLDSEFIENFMGFGERRVSFLGHGVGLYVDELPVIAKGFDKPIKENMVFALEPKKGISQVGMVGGEDTYIITPDGGECITGGGKDIISV
ncbi:M24 family metallopeptidase [Ruminiclostridium cellulolyticum]|uniref:Peptidase M24 n=1 Tax=Ruminiclostridium cellulolyticum (strain ATCC 35319 / DSM 5812 / JCM 6584 / H10) TaxID=394503 RepID=B8I723_RUMCH|nr:Xaa-Pro peptidase family protein [Ruminiclostridium cellulolyticum]ACL74947.1 peptidase M24 [Ruminiclostridium cellulolyticum H10]